MTRLVVTAVVAVALAGCGTTSHVRTIGKGRSAVDVSVGGPIVGLFGTYTPLPLVTAGVTYGALDRFDIHARVHAVSAAFGAPGFDAGVTWLAVTEEGARPAVSGTLRMYGFWGMRPDSGLRLFPEGSLDASYLWNDRWLAWAGVTLFAELSRVNFISAPHLGVGYTPVRGFGATLEVKWMEPTAANAPLTVDYVGVNGRGALAVVLGLTWVFGAPSDVRGGP